MPSSAEAPPDVSVIVPARNAAATIGAMLAALARQDFDGTYEVIVVDDASDDATPAVAESTSARVIRHDAPTGPARARNTGAATAAGAVLAFTDADCEPAPGWLAAGVAALADADLVQGRVAPTPGVPVGSFDRTLRIDEASPRLWESANLLMRRELFDRLGGFTPFTPDAADRPGIRPSISEGHFGEDVWLGWRAVREGARAVFAPDALVHHAVFPRGPRGFIAERWRLRYFPALVREVPELRREFYGWAFLSLRTAHFDLALAGLAACLFAGRRAALLACAPYLLSPGFRRSELWRRSAWRENLARGAADAVTFGALVRGSVAARTIVI